MKHIEKSPVEPERLANYREHHPRDTWDKFHKRDRVGYRQLKEQLLRDQHGLCAYCEISIRLSDNEDEVDDFRVEHFHPKSGTERSEHNYHLDWRNLLGVCHGDSQPYVAEARYRYASRVEDRSCDVPKSDKALENVILNPLEIPASSRLFKYDPFTGAMEVDEETCPRELIRKARRSVEELNLNCERLKRLRRAAMEVLQEQVDNSLQDGLSLDETMALLARAMLDPGPDGRYAAFFTCIRWFLGSAAETFLKQRNYRI